MPEITRAALFGKLNGLCYKTLSSATDLCKLRGNPYVEVAHWLAQIVQMQDSDLHRIVRRFEIDFAKLTKEMTTALDRLPRGSTSISDLSEHIQITVERAWVYGTLMFGESQVRSGHLLLGMLKTPALRYVLLNISRQFERIAADTLAEELGQIVASSPESAMRATDGSALDASQAERGAGDELAPAALGKQEALKRFAVDLTE